MTNKAKSKSTNTYSTKQTAAPTDQPETYTIRQASQLLGIKSSTLRSYCNHGLIPGLRRNARGYRIFSEPQLDLLRNIAYLYRCGLNTAETKRFLRGSPDLKLQILGTKKQQLWQQLNNIRQNIDFIERQEDLIGQNQNSTLDVEF